MLNKHWHWYWAKKPKRATHLNHRACASLVRSFICTRAHVLGNHFSTIVSFNWVQFPYGTLSNDVSFLPLTKLKVTSFFHPHWQKACLCAQRSSASDGGMHAYWQWAVKIYPNNAHSPACSKTSRRFVCICLLTHPSIRMILQEGSFSRIYTSDGLDCPVFQQHMDMYSLLQGETEKPRKLDIWFDAPGKGSSTRMGTIFARKQK